MSEKEYFPWKGLDSAAASAILSPMAEPRTTDEETQTVGSGRDVLPYCGPAPKRDHVRVCLEPQYDVKFGNLNNTGEQGT